jgi:hypothetical protein
MTVTTTNHDDAIGGPNDLEILAGVSNDASALLLPPFSVQVTIEGVADLLLHRWSSEAVAEKAAAAKNSRAKKTDDLESYVARDEDGRICLPATYLKASIRDAGRFHADPRSPRKSALDLLKAAVIVGPVLSPILVGGEPVTTWSYVDRQRVVIQRSAVTRERPAFRVGWRVTFEVTSLLPEYVNRAFLLRLLGDAGRFVGLADFRPTYGRYVVVGWEG